MELRSNADLRNRVRLRARAAVAFALTATAWTLAVTAVAAQPRQPRIHALLVGAVDYSGVGGVQVSNMPSAAGDAAILAAALAQRGAAPGDIRILTDGVPPRVRGLPAGVRQLDTAPTHAAILRELDRLAGEARPGDQVVVALSGHGEQQRSTDPASVEPDGLDEVFLPIDSERRDGTWIRGLTDNELGERIKAIRARGASVLLIADFCHSDGASRSATGAGPAIPEDVRLGNAETDPARVGAVAVGDFAAFYAAPSLTTAKAVSVPYWVPEERRSVHGALSFYLSVALGDPKVRTVGDLQLAVDRAVRTHAEMQGSDTERPPAPQFEGPSTMALPGSDPGAALSREFWSVEKPATDEIGGRTGVERLAMRAGYLQGVREGAIYRLSAVLAHGRERTLIYGRAVEVSADSAVLVPASFDGVGAERWLDLRDHEGLPMIQPWMFAAELVAPARLEALKIALPGPSQTAPPALTQAVARLDGMLARLPENAGQQVVLVQHGTSAPMRLRWDGADLVLERITSASADGGIWSTVGRMRGDVTEREAWVRLSRGLVSAGRFQRMLDVVKRVGAVTDQPGQDPDDGLTIEAFLMRAATPAEDGACVDPAPTWRAGLPPPAGAVRLDPSAFGAPGAVLRCDRIFLSVSAARSQSVAQRIADAMQRSAAHLPENWRTLCDRPFGLAQNELIAAVCDQPVDVALIAFNPDQSIRAVNPDPDGRSATRRILAGGGPIIFSFHVTQAIDVRPVRLDFALLASRPPVRTGVPARFDRFCQTSVQDRFDGRRPEGGDVCNPMPSGQTRGQPGDETVGWMLDEVEGVRADSSRGPPPAPSGARTSVVRFGFDVSGCTLGPMAAGCRR